MSGKKSPPADREDLQTYVDAFALLGYLFIEIVKVSQGKKSGPSRDICLVTHFAAVCKKDSPVFKVSLSDLRSHTKGGNGKACPCLHKKAGPKGKRVPPTLASIQADVDRQAKDLGYLPGVVLDFWQEKKTWRFDLECRRPGCNQIHEGVWLKNIRTGIWRPPCFKSPPIGVLQIELDDKEAGIILLEIADEHPMRELCKAQCQSCGHIWWPFLVNTISRKSGCPPCSPSGFDPTKPSEFYCALTTSALPKYKGLLIGQHGICASTKARFDNGHNKPGKLARNKLSRWTPTVMRRHKTGYKIQKDEAALNHDLKKCEAIEILTGSCEEFAILDIPNFLQFIESRPYLTKKEKEHWATTCAKHEEMI